MKETTTPNGVEHTGRLGRNSSTPSGVVGWFHRIVFHGLGFDKLTHHTRSALADTVLRSLTLLIFFQSSGRALSGVGILNHSGNQINDHGVVEPFNDLSAAAEP